MITSDPASVARHYDVCVMGSGPAGLAVALGCEQRGLSVIVLEAGMAGAGVASLDPTTTILDPARHVPLDVGASQRFGGTSSAWGGLCVALDAIDFEARAHVPHSGWPIAHAEVAQWEDAASRFLGCGAPDASSGCAEWDLAGGLDASVTGRLARHWNLGRHWHDHIARSARLHVLLGARMIDLEIDPERGAVSGLTLTRGEAPRAGSYVIACGGLRSTALLLGIQRRHPAAFGSADGPLGRFYMGHLTGEIATIVLDRAEDARHLLYRLDRDGTPTQRRLRPRDALQRSAALLNTAFTLRSPPLTDSLHGNGALSIAYLASRIPSLRNLFASQRFRKEGMQAIDGRLASHLANVLKHPGATALDSARLLSQARVEKLPLILLNRGGRYSLRYHSEQAPNPDSRVWLGSQAKTGPELCIDFRYQEEDARSVVRAHEALDAALQASGKGRLEYWHPPGERLSAVLAQAGDGYHQLGTTRMGDDPAGSVVDRDCRAHGVRNLFIASSSVFPTSAAANPTFPMICLSLRLAHHIADSLAPARHDLARHDSARLDPATIGGPEAAPASVWTTGAEPGRTAGGNPHLSP